MLTFISASKSDITDTMMSILLRLEGKHGDIKLSKEKNGIQAYMACPCCLQSDGIVELGKKHLSVSLTRYEVLGKDSCGMCMKTSRPYKLSELLRMKPLEARGIEYKKKSGMVDLTENHKSRMEEISPGVFSPYMPGKCIQLSELPLDHPALLYLKSRDFDPLQLQQHFRAAWCETAHPATSAMYAKRENGFNDTPQSRIVFFAYKDNKYVGWQARMLEFENAGKVYYYHPYRKQFEKIFEYSDTGEKFYNSVYSNSFKPSKYLTALGMSRNSHLMGFDVVRQQNSTRRISDRFCILTEGPLDAARAGLHAMPTLGKYISEDQYRMAATQGKIYYITQNDIRDKNNPEKLTPAENASLSFVRDCSHYGIVGEVIKPPVEFKDIGGMSQLDFNEFIKKRIQGYER